MQKYDNCKDFIQLQSRNLFFGHITFIKSVPLVTFFKHFDILSVWDHDTKHILTFCWSADKNSFVVLNSMNCRDYFRLPQLFASWLYKGHLLKKDRRMISNLQKLEGMSTIFVCLKLHMMLFPWCLRRLVS